MRNILDKLADKIASRKLIAWLTATGLMISDNLESADWVLVTAIYIGGTAVIDMVNVWRHGK